MGCIVKDGFSLFQFNHVFEWTSGGYVSISPFFKGSCPPRRTEGCNHLIINIHLLLAEYDGEVHNYPEQILHDCRRDEFLKKSGFQILRINNDLVFCNVPEVLRMIALRFNANGFSTPHYRSVSRRTPQSAEKADSSPWQGSGIRTQRLRSLVKVLVL